VATLIERTEAQRQDRYWRDYEQDEAEEAARFAAQAR
jgi:hypothetical protein